ncbi:hypothetical protein [Saccharopolyspora shandongensis]|uniref:hypothetical protein n=1 Tax=Saccharopolyspora shandongensis TaxID=418495 RepID=UPI0033C6F39C
MTTLMMRKAALPVAVLAATEIVLAGCSSGTDDAARPASGPSPAGSSSTVSDQDLGKALDKLVFSGGQHTSPDGGACLVAVVKRAKLSEKGQAHIVDTSGDDRGAVIEGVRKIDTGDAEVLLSPQLRSSFDACADAVLIPTGTAGG